jgi:hypothetical protein
MTLQKFSLTIGLAFLFVLSIAFLSCGGGSGGSSPMGTGAALTITISDPTVCSASQGGPFRHIYVTITDVQGFTTSGMPDFASGVDLTPNLSQNPVQVDLLGIPNGCVLAELPTSQSVAPGTYRQLAVYLAGSDQVSKIAGGSKCGNTVDGLAANCEVLADGTVIDDDPATTGSSPFVIPTSAIAGGQIVIAQGSQTLNIDFDACASAVIYRDSYGGLDPTMHAALMSSSGKITGQVVDSSTGQPVSGNVVVALEQPDSNAVDRVVLQTSADSDGNFTLCPVPSGTFDVVATAISSSGVSYGATITTGVQAGDSLANVTIVSVNGSLSGINGTVTAAGPAGPLTGFTHIVVSALQSGTVNGTVVFFTIPLVAAYSSSLRTLVTATNNYQIQVAAAGPRVGGFLTSGKTIYQQTGGAQYSVDVQSSCSPAVMRTAAPLTVTPGAHVSAGTIALSGCPPA